MSIQPITDPPDPILEELHATRRQLLKEHGGIAGLAAFLRQEEAKSNRTIVKTSDKLKSADVPNPPESNPAR